MQAPQNLVMAAMPAKQWQGPWSRSAFDFSNSVAGAELQPFASNAINKERTAVPFWNQP
jgi:hypothetical protein